MTVLGTLQEFWNEFKYTLIISESKKRNYLKTEDISLVKITMMVSKHHF